MAMLFSSDVNDEWSLYDFQWYDNGQLWSSYDLLFQCKGSEAYEEWQNQQSWPVFSDPLNFSESGSGP